MDWMLIKDHIKARTVYINICLHRRKERIVFTHKITSTDYHLTFSV